MQPGTDEEIVFTDYKDGGPRKRRAKGLIEYLTYLTHSLPGWNNDIVHFCKSEIDQSQLPLRDGHIA